MSLPLCSSRGGGQKAPQVYFPEKGGGRIGTPPPTLVMAGGGGGSRAPWKAILCKKEKVFGISNQVFQGQVVSVHMGHWWLFQAILARMGQPGSNTAQGTLTLLVGSGLWFLPTFSVKRSGRMMRKPRSMRDITETDKHLFALNVLTEDLFSVATDFYQTLKDLVASTHTVLKSDPSF